MGVILDGAARITRSAWDTFQSETDDSNHANHQNET